MRVATIESPPGPFTIVASDGASVLASGWTSEPQELVALIAPALRGGALRECVDLGPITRAADDYFNGDLGAIDSVDVEQRSGPFLEEAWRRLREVRPGAPVTYTQLAARAGHADAGLAARAAASACARNAAALFVPCHRVVRTGGGLGGFRWGLEVKRWLLAHEGGSAVAGEDRGGGSLSLFA